MIEKLEKHIIGENAPGMVSLMVAPTAEQQVDKINEIIDDLHELKALYKEYDKSLTAAIESINVHERQIDKLQMMLEPIKCKTRPENVQPGVESRPENVQDEIDKAKREGRVLFPDPADVATTLTKSLRMDKELAEDECVRLQDELGRTKRALEIAVKHLREITDVGGWSSIFSEREIAQQALEQITTITKGGENE